MSVAAKGSQWNAGEIAANARDHLLQPWEEMDKVGAEARTILTGGDGIYVIDTRGRRLIDGPGGMWCSQVGHGRREIADAIGAQALQLEYNSPWYSTSSPAAELAARIADRTPGDLNHVFFTTGGSTAVDSALRFIEFANNIEGRPAKKIILSRINSYHGSTGLTAAASGRAFNRKNFDVDSDRISFLSSPNCYRRPAGMDLAQYADFLVDELEQRIETLGAGRIAAFIAEPIQASGGLLMPPPGYLARAAAVCRRHDIVVIADEVVTAFGRLGHWFASEAVFGFTPDIIAFAKGLTSGYVPMGGLAISDRLLARVSGDNGKGSWFSNGYTYSGHPVAAAAGIANIDLFERDNLLMHVRAVAPYFQSRLAELRELPLVGDVRGDGLMAGVECVSDRSAVEASDFDLSIAKRVDRYCFELGLIVRPIANICVMSPPLIITLKEIDRLVDILREGIERTQMELRHEGLWHG